MERLSLEPAFGLYILGYSRHGGLCERGPAPYVDIFKANENSPYFQMRIHSLKHT